MRCEECGEVRWSILGRAEEGCECPQCGAGMTAERRRPGRREPFGAERRQLSAAITASGASSGTK